MKARESVLLCEGFTAPQEIRKTFRICHKTVVMLAKYIRNKASGKADLLNICVTPQTQTPGEVGYLLLSVSI